MFLQCEKIFSTSQSAFEYIPGWPIAYWVSQSFINMFTNPSLKEFGFSDGQLLTGDNEKYLRLIWETANPSKKWKPITKGGSFRKWYGNVDYVVDFSPEAIFHYQTNKISRLLKEQYWYREAITWSDISSSSQAFRYLPTGCLFNKAAPSFFIKREEDRFKLLGLLNSKVADLFLKVINPSFHTTINDVMSLPCKFISCDELVRESIGISKEDWDAHETSWDFKENELVRLFKEHGPSFKMLGQTLNIWSTYQLEYVPYWSEKFGKLRDNEIELNRKFIEIYGLQDELSPDVPLDEVTILQQGEIDLSKTTPMVMISQENGDEKREPGYGLHFNDDVIIKQLISYIVGCYMGRYRLDKQGLAIAHPNPTEEELADYAFNIAGEETFKIDPDGIIPVLPQGAPFYDNLINYVSDFIRKVWGKDTYTENMNFIDRCLGKPLNDYLMKDFWKYHKKMYQNRPIYWEFASPKGAFRALVYAHRMDRYTVEVLRSKYLLPYINFIEQKIANLDARANDLCTAERRELDNLRNKTLPELREYHDRVQQVAAETATRETVFDLDDGIPHNHALFGSIVTKLK